MGEKPEWEAPIGVTEDSVSCSSARRSLGVHWLVGAGRGRARLLLTRHDSGHRDQLLLAAPRPAGLALRHLSPPPHPSRGRGLRGRLRPTSTRPGSPPLPASRRRARPPGLRRGRGAARGVAAGLGAPGPRPRPPDVSPRPPPAPHSARALRPRSMGLSGLVCAFLLAACCSRRAAGEGVRGGPAPGVRPGVGGGACSVPERAARRGRGRALRRAPLLPGPRRPGALRVQLSWAASSQPLFWSIPGAGPGRRLLPGAGKGWGRASRGAGESVPSGAYAGDAQLQPGQEAHPERIPKSWIPRLLLLEKAAF